MYATVLADIQGQRVRNPEAASAAHIDDRTAALDRENLGVPAYWLGMDFDPGNGLPVIGLTSSSGPLLPGNSPGNRVEVTYGTGRSGEGVRLAIWASEHWQASLATRLGDHATAPPCNDPVVIEAGDRRIEIHAGHESGALPRVPGATAVPTGTAAAATASAPREGEAACPEHRVGHVYFADAVVAINAPYSFLSAGRTGSAFDAEAAIDAVARGLRRR